MTLVDVMQYWKNTKPKIDAEINELLPSFAQKTPLEHVQILKRSMESGKRVRGELTCLLCGAGR